MKVINIFVSILIFTFILFSCTKKTAENNVNIEYYDEIFEEKYYEIKNADEFREKLSLYHFEIDNYYQKNNIKKETEIFKLNINEETLLSIVSDYLYENNLFNENLLNSIISVLKGEIRKDYFSEINVFLNDIYYGQYLFYFSQDELFISICFYKAAGIDTYFYKRFFLDNLDIWR